MSIDTILVIIFCLCGVVGTYWFFLASNKDSVQVHNQEIDILVEGGYTPEVIRVPVGKETSLNFIRKDDNSCLEEVVLGDFKIRRFLPLGKKVSIKILPRKKGEYVYSCGMNMYHGRIQVV